MEAAAYLNHKYQTQKHLKESVIFEQHNVYVHYSVLKERVLAGVLKVVEKENCHLVLWRSYSNKNTALNVPENETQVLGGTSSAVVACSKNDLKQSPEQNKNVIKEAIDPEWMMVADNIPKPQTKQTPDESTSPIFEFTVPLEELSIIKKSKQIVAWKYLVLELADKVSLPPLHFHQGGCEKFLEILDNHLILIPSSKNPYLLNVSAYDESAMMKSFDENFVDRKTFTSRAIHNPMTTALSSFSKMTNFLQDVFNPQEIPPRSRPAKERAEVVAEDETEAVGSTRIRIKRGGESSAGFEVITCANLGPRSDPPRKPPMDVFFWNNHKDKEGRITKIDKVKNAIFRGGIAPELRKEVWKYLLGYYEWGMSRDELKQLKKEKEEDYYRMKLQWKSLSPEQEERFFAFKDHKSLVEKDVNRTDRTRTFFEGNENVSLQMLNDILLTYVMYNFNLGYVQGMNDLLSPILELINNEADAFWCFVGFMNMVHLNFDERQTGIKKQLRDLRSLLQFLDPNFMDNLLLKESHNLYFCFRWLLIRFKREFSFEDIQTLWEVLWTGLPCRNFHLLICVALLDTEKSKLILPEYEATEILKHINELSENIDLEATLRKAEGIYNQLATCKRDISDDVCDILGLK